MGMSRRHLELGGLIRLVRQRRGYSARQLSAMAGYSPSYVGKIEKGEIEPSLQAFAKIAKILNLSQMEVTYLLNKAAE